MYLPSNSGEFNIFNAREKLVQKGMMAEQADQLAEDYLLNEHCSRPYRFYTLLSVHDPKYMDIKKQLRESKGMKQFDFSSENVESYREKVRRVYR